VQHSELVRELIELSKQSAPVEIVHYNGRKEEGRLNRVSTNDSGDIILILRPHQERERGGHTKVVKHERPVIFREAKAETARTKGRRTISMSREDDTEHGFTININTIPGADRVE
jgi:hypothetical protein